jgi:hypothetical protein
MEKSAEHPDAPNLVLEAARFGEVGPEAEPGKTYAYSNPGYNTLAAIVEIVSGRGLRAVLPSPLLPAARHERDLQPRVARGSCPDVDRGPEDRRRQVGRALDTRQSADGAVCPRLWWPDLYRDGLLPLLPALARRRHIRQPFHPLAEIGPGGHEPADEGHRGRPLRFRLAHRRGRSVLPRRVGRNLGLVRPQARCHRHGADADAGQQGPQEARKRFRNLVSAACPPQKARRE